MGANRKEGGSVTDAVNRSLVLIVGKSKVNSIVVSRVVELMGLKFRAEKPDVAASVLLEMRPSIVILDGGSDNRECDALLEDLQRARESSPRGFPAVILLSTANKGGETAPIGPVVDMIVSKPLTVDRLLPSIEALRARNGDYATPR